MSKENNNLEQKLLNSDYEKEFQESIEQEIIDAKKEAEARAKKDERKVIITDIKQISPDKRFDKETIYRVFNRKQKTETFVTGEQAENMLRYTDDYIVKFDHRVEYS